MCALVLQVAGTVNSFEADDVKPLNALTNLTGLRLYRMRACTSLTSAIALLHRFVYAQRCIWSLAGATTASPSGVPSALRR